MKVFIFKKIGMGNALKSLLLALLLGVAGLMNAQNTITEIYVDGFTPPAWGEHADYDLTVPEGAPYSIFSVDWDKLWGDFTPQSVFDDEYNEYFMIVYLTPAEGYAFDPDATVYFNGDPSIYDAGYSHVMSNGDFRIYTVSFQVTAPSGGDLSYNFEDGTLQGWTTIDADGDGFDWYNYYGWGHNDSDHFATSESYDSASGMALTPDNYLVSPQVELGGSISFWACAMDANFPEEHFGVAVSTTSNTNPSAFTMLNEWTITAKRVDDRSQTEWLQYTVDLSAYAGRTGYVAIRHFGCTDQYLLNVDDIEITLGATGVSEQNEMAMRVYPNPAGESLRIEGLEADATVEIYNILGSLVKTVNVTPDQEINVGELSEGLYLLRCGQQTLRFVKE
ncbi:MAG: choice-of-anchor J domain-containing protein [Bacteroidales bacterium]|nr:choice-of-anchor J domain-containing protein [Bacteroidales bacterium]